MDIKMQAIHKTPDLGDGKVVDPVSVTYKAKKGSSKDSCCSIDEEKRQLRAGRPIWKENFIEFCRYGTVHGLRHIVDGYSRTRKVIWLVIVILVLILFLYNIIVHIVAYLQYPLVTVVSVQYEAEQHFPTITICNKNPCRMSAAYKRGWQGLLHSNSTASRYLESVEVLDYQRTCAQSLETMIVKCEFNGIKCALTDFQETYTELGLCYTFNTYNSSQQMKAVRSSGASAGLSLLLNAETAEYAPSKSGQEGFQISVHNDEQMAAVNEEGLSIAPGTSTNIALQRSEYRSLPAPYGNCGQKPILSPGPYSHTKCLNECLMNLIRQKCFCDAVFFNIPKRVSTFPICGMKIYDTCVKSVKTNFTTNGNPCDCPKDCVRNQFSTSASFSRLSNPYIEEVMKSKTGVTKNVEEDFVQNKLLQYHHANQVTENQRLYDVIQAYNASISVTYPELTASVATIGDVLKTLADGSNGRDQFLARMRNLLNDYNTKYHATVFSALQSARFLVNKYLDAVTAFAFVTEKVNYTSGTMDENRVSQILRLKLDEFRIHYEHTIQALDRVDKFFTDKDLQDFSGEHIAARRAFRIGIISLYANISSISMHQSSDIDKYYHVADTFNQIILPQGTSAYEWYRIQVETLTKTVEDLSQKLTESVKIVLAGPRQWDNFKDATMYRTGSPSYVYESEKHWAALKEQYLKTPGNVSLRELIVHRASGDLTNLTHFTKDLNEDLARLESATEDSLNYLEQLYTELIQADILPSSVLGSYQIWNRTGEYLELRIRWGSLVNRNRPVFKSVFIDAIQRVREKLLSRRIKRHYYPNGIFDQLESAIRDMDKTIHSTLTKLKDYMTYFLNSVSIEKVFKQELYTDNFCQVNIFYKDLASKRYDQQPAFSVRDLFFYIAVAVAIYFGGSLFSFIELIDLAVRSIYTKYCLRASADT